jgi:ribulose-phosphate 3-epimerase
MSSIRLASAALLVLAVFLFGDAAARSLFAPTTAYAPTTFVVAQNYGAASFSTPTVQYVVPNTSAPHISASRAALYAAGGAAFVAMLYVSGAAAQSKTSAKRAGSAKMLQGEPRPVQIIPSVLPADWANMGADCKRLEDAGVDRIQFDVMDGNFVPNLTFGPEMIAACRKYTKVPFETQLMVSNYNCDTMLEQYVEASKGPNGEPGVVIAHVEANVHLHRTLANIRAFGGSPSVALNPHTPAEMIENVLDLVDHVLVMTVNPGFGGQAYIPTMTEKIRKIRGWIVERGLDVDIEVDGGVKADWTIAQCAEAGANCFIAGSGMFAYDDLSEGCEALRKVAVAAQKGDVMAKP